LSNAGRSYIFLSSELQNSFNHSTINSATNGIKISGSTTNENFGYSVSFLGDINGDLLSDFMIGAFGWNSYRIFLVDLWNTLL
jgi:hypothetical protein